MKKTCLLHIGLLLRSEFSIVGLCNDTLLKAFRNGFSKFTSCILFRLSFFCMISIIFMMGCQQEKNSGLNTVQFTIHATAYKNSEINISTVDMFSYADSTLAEVRLDSAGLAVVKLSVPQPVLANLKVDQHMMSHTLFLSPGDDLEMVIQPTEDWQNITFAGTGSEVNNYLEQVAHIKGQHLKVDGKYIFQLEKEEFITQLETMKDAFTTFHQGYTDTVPLPKALSTSLKNKNGLELVTLKENYELAHYLEHHPTSELSEEIVLERPVGGPFKVPVDTTFLHNPMLAYYYGLALDWLTTLQVGWPVAIKLGRLDQEKDFPTDSLITIMDKIIRKGNFPSGIKEYCIAKNIYTFLENGITPGLDSIYKHFKETYSHSTYIAPIEKRYSKWMAFAPGRPAPDFTGTTLDGKKVSLSDLVGKVVYIDVWATWCGPCIQEFPYSKKLQKHFEGSEEVVFLYVSIDADKDQEKWKKMVTEKDLKGMHIRDSPKGENSIWNLYMLSGVPRYILVDQEGKLVNANAPKPSSSTIKSEIQDLLII